ncbi:hypothetical protein QLG10_03260 [Pseudomonas sp. V98_8]|uniref:phage tail assembly protein T n=1 Tax=Pseudomonas sp. V98_8 TaxID=3044228 RepID=UPI00249F53C7|nr:hypothetical protein [Pseudomonas sp. V98_8]MDI3391446.1 hypothetical protein [Pseudomonas sp. V98_8]
MRIERSVALLAALIANQNRDPKKRPMPYTVADFAPHDTDDRVISLVEAMSTWA